MTGVQTCALPIYSQSGGMYFGFHSARPYSADPFTSLSENFHIVIFYGGFGGHCFVFEPESDYDPEFVLNGNPFGYFAPYADGQCRVISVNRTDFYRKQNNFSGWESKGVRTNPGRTSVTQTLLREMRARCRNASK